MSLPRKTIRHTGSVLAAAVVALGLLAGCGQESEQDAGVGAGASEDTRAGIAAAKEVMATLGKPLAEYPAEPALSSSPDMAGKSVMIIPLGDQIPVIHGEAIGIQQAMEAVGATTKLCDGKFNPTTVAGCLKQAGDQDADAVVTLFVDYAMAGTAFDALAEKGVPTLIAGVPPTGGRTADETLAFYDTTERSNKMFEAMATSAVASGGEDAKALFLRLMDSSMTRAGSDAGIAKFRELCPTCEVATVDFTTANLDKLPTAVSGALVSHPNINTLLAPVDSFVAPAVQGIQSAGKGGKVKIFSSGSDLAGMQRVADDQQVSDLGIPVIYEGWKMANSLMQLLAGDEVAPQTVLVTRDFNADNVGDLDLSDDAYFSMDWFGNESFKDSMLASWGVK